MNKYWQADNETSAAILALLKERLALFADGKKIAKRVGADPKNVYFSDGSFGTTRITGFVFAAGSPPDKSWVRLKGTDDGWKPRANSPLKAEFSGMEVCTHAKIHKLIGMNAIGPGLTIRRAGVSMVDGVAYLICPGDVEPIGCERISDVEFERATAPKKKAAKVAK